MTAKQWLSRGRGLDREIDSLLRTKQETKDRLTSITQNYDSDGAQSTKDPHKFDRLLEIENLIDNKIDELVAVKAEILAAIFKLEDYRERAVLKGRYIDMKTFEEIAVDVHYSWKQTHRIHARGLKAIEQIVRGSDMSF